MNIRQRSPPEVCDRCQNPFTDGMKNELPYVFKQNGAYERKWICNKKECWDIEKAFEQSGLINGESRRQRNIDLYGRYNEHLIPDQVSMIVRYRNHKKIYAALLRFEKSLNHM